MFSRYPSTNYIGFLAHIYECFKSDSDTIVAFIYKIVNSSTDLWTILVYLLSASFLRCGGCYNFLTANVNFEGP
jgi:hypothetical protein